MTSSSSRSGRDWVQLVPAGSLVARIGGDEFVVVLAELRDVAHAAELADGIRRSFVAPFRVGESELYTSASLGVAYYDGATSGMDAETMIRDADTAMYQAKDAGRDGVAVFDTSMHDQVTERLALERDLRQGIERGELHLHFQPVVQLGDGRIEGFEALLRWNHPVLGAIPPVKFIPIAEDTGLIVEIGAWVVREACRRVAQWRREIGGAEHLYVAVNVSGRAAPRRRLRRYRQCRAVRERSARRGAGRRAHGVRPDGRPRRRHRGPGRPAGHERPAADRRLRDRLLVARLSQALSG